MYLHVYDKYMYVLVVLIVCIDLIGYVLVCVQMYFECNCIYIDCFISIRQWAIAGMAELLCFSGSMLALTKVG